MLFELGMVSGPLLLLFEFNHECKHICYCLQHKFWNAYYTNITCTRGVPQGKSKSCAPAVKWSSQRLSTQQPEDVSPWFIYLLNTILFTYHTCHINNERDTPSIILILSSSSSILYKYYNTNTIIVWGWSPRIPGSRHLRARPDPWPTPHGHTFLGGWTSDQWLINDWSLINDWCPTQVASLVLLAMTTACLSRPGHKILDTTEPGRIQARSTPGPRQIHWNLDTTKPGQVHARSTRT